MKKTFFLLYALAWPLMRVLFVIASRFNPKIKRGLEDRIGKPWLGTRGNTKPIWFHCASGEFEYAKPVIRELKKRDPTLPIMVTYFSPTMAHSIRSFKGVDFACPAPWDTSLDMNRFLEHHKPRALLIARTDAWPMMVHETKLRNIPSLLFSATLAENSGRMKVPGRWVSEAVFPLLKDIFTVSDLDKKNFEELGASARTSGDTRFDQVQARLIERKPIRKEIFEGASLPVLVAGSTWPEDEVVLLPATFKLKEKLKLILVPHEPTDAHLADIESRLRSLGLSFVRYSHATKWTEDVLIVDKTGILAELYLQGNFAFVGGSFRKTVHSVMEPLAAGCVTFVGPLHRNNREAIEFQTFSVTDDVSPVISVQTESDLVGRLTSLSKLVESTEQKEILQSKIKAEIAKRSGASVRVADWVQANV
jgi:3-deoxy-D-manno-octulosonic-acid transferase